MIVRALSSPSACTLLLAFSFWIRGCGQDDVANAADTSAAAPTAAPSEPAVAPVAPIAAVAAASAEPERATKPGGWEKLKMLPLRDGNGTLIVEMPFPAGWKQNAASGPGQPSITWPDGISITNFPVSSFMFTADPQMQQIYRQGGQQLRAFPGVDAVVQQDIVPWGQQSGHRLLRSFAIEEVARIDQWYSDQLFKVVPTQSKNFAIGSEWESANGRPFFLLVHLSVSESAELQTWAYWSTGLEAEREVFARAQTQLIFGLARALRARADRRVQPTRDGEGGPELGGARTAHAPELGELRGQPARVPEQEPGRARRPHGGLAGAQRRLRQSPRALRRHDHRAHAGREPGNRPALQGRQRGERVLDEQRR
ncbi:MAG: hypothetical protein FJ091_09670 [Deltaproteobacteria bacterium]|nr:hypothetical protein [Deltaproteobacteria bacterium]